MQRKDLFNIVEGSRLYGLAVTGKEIYGSSYCKRMVELLGAAASNSLVLNKLLGKGETTPYYESSHSYKFLTWLLSWVDKLICSLGSCYRRGAAGSLVVSAGEKVTDGGARGTILGLWVVFLGFSGGVLLFRNSFNVLAGVLMVNLLFSVLFFSKLTLQQLLEGSNLWKLGKYLID